MFVCMCIQETKTKTTKKPEGPTSSNILKPWQNARNVYMIKEELRWLQIGQGLEMLNFKMKQNTLKSFKVTELKRFANSMPAIISFLVQANLFLFNKTNLAPLVCIGIIQAFGLSIKREVRRCWK